MTGGARELFVPENDFKAFSAVKLPKKHPDCGGLKTNQRHEIQTFFLWSSIYKLNII